MSERAASRSSLLVRGLWALPLSAWLGCLGCNGARETSVAQSAGHVVRAVERLRNAPNPAKAEPLEALEKTACAAPDICQAREACAAAYALHLEATQLTEAAKLKLASGQAAEAAGLLGVAEQKLQQAARDVAACTDQEAALRRRYKL